MIGLGRRAYFLKNSLGQPRWVATVYPIEGQSIGIAKFYGILYGNRAISALKFGPCTRGNFGLSAKHGRFQP